MERVSPAPSTQVYTPGEGIDVMSVQTVKFALKMGNKTVVFEPKSKRHMIRLVKKALTTHGARARAAAVIKGIDALVAKEGMVYPSQTKQAIAHRARRKARSISALDCALFIKALPGTESLEGYNLALASFMERNNEGTDATAKTIQVAEGSYPVESGKLAAFAEMRKNGGRYTKMLKASRKARKARALLQRQARREAWLFARTASFARSIQSSGSCRTKKSGTYILPKGVALSVGQDLSRTNRGTSTSISCRSNIEDVAKATKPLTKAAFLLSAHGGDKKALQEQRQEAARKRRAKRRKNGKSRSSRAAAINGGSGESAKQNNPAYEGNC